MGGISDTPNPTTTSQATPPVPEESAGPSHTGGSPPVLSVTATSSSNVARAPTPGNESAAPDCTPKPLPQPMPPSIPAQPTAGLASDSPETGIDPQTRPPGQPNAAGDIEHLGQPEAVGSTEGLGPLPQRPSWEWIRSNLITLKETCQRALRPSCLNGPNVSGFRLFTTDKVRLCGVEVDYFEQLFGQKVITLMDRLEGLIANLGKPLPPLDQLGTNAVNGEDAKAHQRAKELLDETLSVVSGVAESARASDIAKGQSILRLCAKIALVVASAAIGAIVQLYALPIAVFTVPVTIAAAALLVAGLVVDHRNRNELQQKFAQVDQFLSQMRSALALPQPQPSDGPSAED